MKEFVEWLYNDKRHFRLSQICLPRGAISKIWVPNNGFGLNSRFLKDHTDEKNEEKWSNAWADVLIAAAESLDE